ncbi:MAG: flippase-like domain-containing protein [Acidobacteriales bacterium]|nr:flippase-like domain-containing protein [Terriglobales bacterium]
MLNVLLRLAGLVVGVGLLALLIHRSGPETIWNQVHKVGSGLIVIIILGGFAYFIRTWVWRLTFAPNLTTLSWPRSFGAYLASEALGQLGVGGKAVGEGIRIALLRPLMPLPNALSSVAIDGALHLLTSTAVMLSGVIAVLFMASTSGKWRMFQFALSAVLSGLLVLAIVAYGNGWRLIGRGARAIARIPRVHGWMQGKLPVIDSSEDALLAFSRTTPGAFRAALLLSFLWQALAMLEIYVILRYLGVHVTVFGAFLMEGLTKLINLVGAFSPGNIGTYEGGNMLITGLVGASGTAGLTLALCRRARVLFWGLIGVAYLATVQKPRQHNKVDLMSESAPEIAQL